MPGAAQQKSSALDPILTHVKAKITLAEGVKFIGTRLWELRSTPKELEGTLNAMKSSQGSQQIAEALVANTSYTLHTEKAEGDDGQ